MTLNDVAVALRTSCREVERLVIEGRLGELHCVRNVRGRGRWAVDAEQVEWWRDFLGRREATLDDFRAAVVAQLRDLPDGASVLIPAEVEQALELWGDYYVLGLMRKRGLLEAFESQTQRFLQPRARNRYVTLASVARVRRAMTRTAWSRERYKTLKNAVMALDKAVRDLKAEEAQDG